MHTVLADRAPVRLRRPPRLLRLASDERLVAFVRQGDHGAFEALYDRHHAAILGFCRHMLGSREEAEDAVQHTFLAAFRDLARNDKPIDLRPWLFAIARNRCLSLLRARRAHVTLELAEPATDGLAATVERREDLRELLGDLARLPEEQRAALLLAELGALDHAGIASVLGCPREKVKALVFQARTSLTASREARATPCDEIRLELATASGAALRRGPLQRHLRSCEGCSAFKAEVATQRKLLALALPVAPSMALKAAVMSGSGATASGAGAASGSALGGALGTLATTGAGKVALSIVVAGAVTGGGVLTDRLQRPSGAPTTGDVTPARTGDQSWPLPPDGVPTRLQRSGAGAHRSPTRDAPAVPLPRDREQRGATTQPPAYGTAPLPRPEAAPPGRATPPPGQAETPPGHTGTAPGHTTTPPGHGSLPPGQGGTPPGQAKTPPGQGRTPPGQATEPPGQTTVPPGQGGTPPGQATEPPGQTTVPPGQSSIPPGQTRGPAAAEDSTGAAGSTGNARGHADGAPGNSGNAPGHAG